MAASLHSVLARPLGPILRGIERLRFRLRGSSLARRKALHRAFSLTLVAAVTLVVHGTLRSAEAARSAWGATVSVVMTTSPVEGGEALGRSTLHLVDVPRAMAPASALSKLPTGQRARIPLDRGEILTASKVAEGSAGPIAARLATGTQAVTLPLGDSPAPLARGDLVDVYGIVPDRGGTAITSASMTVVARSAVVMELTDSAATLAVVDDEVPATVEATAGGGLRIVITG
ncbi:MAG: SAF domain-containing protein [Microthrixaceae bacterium]